METLNYLISGVGFLFLAYRMLWEYNEWTRDERIERRLKIELYKKGVQHGLRGYQQDPDDRIDYVNGYNDGLKQRSISDELNFHQGVSQ